MTKSMYTPTITNDEYTINQVAIALGLSYDTVFCRYKRLGGDIKQGLTMTDVLNVAQCPSRNDPRKHFAAFLEKDDEEKATNLMTTLMRLQMITASDMEERLAASRASAPRPKRKTDGAPVKEEPSKTKDVGTEDELYIRFSGAVLEDLKSLAGEDHTAYSVILYTIHTMLYGIFPKRSAGDTDIQEVHFNA